MRALAIRELHRYHWVVTSGVGDPLQTKLSFILRVDPTEAVPVTVNTPEVIAGDIPISAVASEKTEFDETVLVAISATLMYLPAWLVGTLNVIAMAPGIVEQLGASVLVWFEQEYH